MHGTPPDERDTHARRVQAIGSFRVADIVSAPGHKRLRNPEAVTRIATQINAGDLEHMFDEPLLLGIFTRKVRGTTLLHSVDCLDGHHRLLAGFVCGVWDRIEDLPAAAIDTRVNGRRVDASDAEDRWIPLHVAERSGLPGNAWAEVPPEWGAKGPTARISGAISGRDPVFLPEDRGVSFAQLARAWTFSTAMSPRER